MEKAILTCALTGVLTNPKQHPVPVTPKQMAAEARDAFNAGAAIMHVHVRNQEEGMGHMPSWDPDVMESVVNAIRQACPGVIINLTTGVVGKDISGPLGCIRRVKPEIAACNAGSLNYLKIKEDGNWAWPPMVFDNPVAKVQQFLDVMASTGTHPEFECFDVGIVRSVGMYLKAGMLTPAMGRAEYNLVMGVASGMPCDADLLALIPRWMVPGSVWQSTLIGRTEIWPVHQKTADLGGMLRTGLEDTFYLPNGERAKGNGELITALAECARNAGRSVASPAEARVLLGLAH
ncbi:MAG: 3-keto-5-aminohexanoate cleavage protein [Gammaproteobacteria bacterium]|uniref:3-keto-5-aminohexanoate cleavage protein n=1 Tax=Rhodoferax sp. TaxID=50421 RepID=UPI0017C88581|nr:3-keto-5-aminohexanoate cleavage protein [Rhodoferax sp.]MBU3899814.1 3-keto-5-aminohexanoate cleavage protein [Gammaproteobacteria bacterium]MBA3059842.1 3-keto-5-aminohexanoate cleavage protein [Rhodoferax sp.]MBU3998845.1 3-keto-5-aminohexanoate cleavage protein [Gammaproteobacteria bacterium]MBU4019078.1 3-keto-5-aminohexanoate cleavage protein [Gammaproteobacteria bacterium]MBU4078797.1 3-keto-5-aminohexanoate cleavage protein [Gammaproteobacteria bacterium]